MTRRALLAIVAKKIKTEVETSLFDARHAPATGGICNKPVIKMCLYSFVEKRRWNIAHRAGCAGLLRKPSSIFLASRASVVHGRLFGDRNEAVMSPNLVVLLWPSEG